MIKRSPNGPICPHCGQVNPAVLFAIEPPASTSESLHGEDQEPAKLVNCIHCRSPFAFYIERLPFFVTEDANEPRCNCNLHNGSAQPGTEHG